MRVLSSAAIDNPDEDGADEEAGGCGDDDVLVHRVLRLGFVGIIGLFRRHGFEGQGLVIIGEVQRFAEGAVFDDGLDEGFVRAVTVV